MTTNVTNSANLLDVLKKKMRQTKEEMEKYKDECDEFVKRLQQEVKRREEVSITRGLPWSCTRFSSVVRCIWVRGNSSIERRSEAF